VNQLIRLPVSGDPIRYPFDRFRLDLVVYATTVAADDTETVAAPALGTGLLNFSVENRIPRIKMDAPHRQVSPPPNLPFIQFDDTLKLSRPLYLEVMTSLLVLLVTAAAAYAVFMRPLDQLIINSGALVLGVWGIRAILLGSGLSLVTLVDLSLSGVILFLLVGITVRTLWVIEARTGLYILRPRSWARPRTPPGAHEAEESGAAEGGAAEAGEAERPEHAERHAAGRLPPPAEHPAAEQTASEAPRNAGSEGRPLGS
jgi:hypothetical protein